MEFTWLKVVFFSTARIKNTFIYILNCPFVFFFLNILFVFNKKWTGERYDFVITADQPVGAYWVQLRGLGECGIKRVQQLAILRYARGPYQPAAPAPTYDVGIPQGVVSTKFKHTYTPKINYKLAIKMCVYRICFYQLKYGDC